ncbi:TIGR02281 family clan AA aspartic protease [Tropicibacter naphthalenivorans]|uniref:Clan AA aspartic protease n=1 Tax=Tropicibacter naphthalenivorans TaxID=441103 RepID=A0A0P1GEP1_9RHOB|nr:TIGR02281 family clan AA aspartic protease [Tropicibacter naphthalenivorans]CUH80155.1 clan AA aspartic protease [Tropicibacter naphthalenivorans]SMC84888.1 aspartyl protease family protein [Tropicibacter naphthalenivorans]
MNGDQIGNLIYLVVLGTALVSWYVVQNRGGLGKMMQHAALWGLIFVGAIAAIGLWDDIRQDVNPQQSVFADQGRIELPRAPDGHYYISLDVNGVPTRFVVDTGASAVVLTREAAARAGLTDNLIFLTEARTANGSVKTAPVRLETVALGPFEDRNLPAYVNGGEMETSLLGMTYLNRFDRIELSGGKLVLER